MSTPRKKRLNPLSPREHLKGMATVSIKPTFDAAALIEQHQARLWRYLRYLGCDDAQADDLLQETFLAVLRKGIEDRGYAATSAYLRTTARNLFLMALRQSSRQPLLEDLESAEQVWCRWHGDDGGEAHLEALRACLETLDGRARRAVDLRYREERGRAAMAAELEMSEDGVKTLLRRTRELIRRCIASRLEQ